MNLAKVNNALLALIILVNLYVVLAPLLPAANFQWENRNGVRRKQLAAALRPHQVPPSQPNHVVIPSMLLNQPIYEGPVRDQYQTLDRGIWLWPAGSTPDKDGNTILIGHRFTYTNPRGVFYYLNKVKAGDEIGLWWNNREFLYKVSAVKVVPPTDTSVEDNTARPRLTLFTCTPLWLPKDRLVVVADLEAKP